MRISGSNLLKIAQQFTFPGKISDIVPITKGLINHTYLIKITDQETGFIMQKINKSVFNRPQDVMDNLVKITGHLSIKNTGERYRYPSLIPVASGSFSFVDSNEDHWRVMDFFSGTASVDSVTIPAHAFEAARAFGHFVYQLSDLNTGEILETIPHFHDYENRIRLYDQSLRKNYRNRRANCPEEMEYAENNFDLITGFNALKLPVRIIHGDAKIDNILFDTSLEKALAVIDLDIAMPASPLYDFGDMVRSYTNTVREDNPDLDAVEIKLDIFRALSQGFLSETGTILTAVEKKNLLMGARLVIFIQGIRNLTDYLNGDIYYRIDYPDHNLTRARNQFTMLKKIEQMENKLEEILIQSVETYSNR